MVKRVAPNIFFLFLTLFCLVGFSQTAYITNSIDSTVSVINLSTNTVSATIKVGGWPFGVSCSSDGTKVYVVNKADNSISVINTSTNTVSAIISGIGTELYGIAVSPDGTKVYVVNSNANGKVTVIDAVLNIFSDTIAIGSYPTGIAVSPDGSKVYVTNYNDNTISVINTVANTVSTTITVGANPQYVAVSPNGNTLYVANYGIGGNTVSVVNTATNAVTTTIDLNNEMWGAYSIALTPDGAKAYVVNYLENLVSVINTATNTVSSTINLYYLPVNDFPPDSIHFVPIGVSISPDGSKAYVAGHKTDNSGNGLVTVINTANDSISDTLATGRSSASFGNFISTYTGEIANVSNLTIDEFNILIYPNPAQYNCNILLPNKLTFNLKIIDITSRKVFENKNATGNVTVDCSGFSSGVYFVKAVNENTVLTGKLVIE